MEAQHLAFIILTPFAIAFIYAGFHEYRRYNNEGKANYGLVFDEETGTSHVTGIAEDEDGYDHKEFDPSDYNDPEIKQDEFEDEGDETTKT